MVDNEHNDFNENMKTVPPVLICNMSSDKIKNDKIYNRIFPISGNNINVLDYRGSYMVCKNYTNLQCAIKDKDGDYPQKTYGQNIDVESRLRYTKKDPNPINARNTMTYGEEYQRQFELLTPNCQLD